LALIGKADRSRTRYAHIPDGDIQFVCDNLGDCGRYPSTQLDLTEFHRHGAVTVDVEKGINVRAYLGRRTANGEGNDETAGSGKKGATWCAAHALATLLIPATDAAAAKIEAMLIRMQVWAKPSVAASVPPPPA
jgi:hypothetical protein